MPQNSRSCIGGGDITYQYGPYKKQMEWQETYNTKMKTFEQSPTQWGMFVMSANTGG